MKPTPSPQSSDDDITALETLCRRLSGFDEGLDLEWLDGCLAALIVGPRTVMPGEWMPRLLGDAWSRAFADPEDVQQAMNTLMGRWNVIAGQLRPEPLADAPDTLRLVPLIGDFDPAVRDALVAEGKLSAAQAADWPLSGELWANGFLDVVQAWADDWADPPADNDDAEWYHACLQSLRALTLRDTAQLQADLAERYPGETLSRDDLIDEACFAVQDLRLYWIDHAPRPAPRRVEAVPGRNDPCRCGSGRKFKKCHGAPGAVH